MSTIGARRESPPRCQPASPPVIPQGLLSLRTISARESASCWREGVNHGILGIHGIRRPRGTMSKILEQGTHRIQGRAAHQFRPSPRRRARTLCALGSGTNGLRRSSTSVCSVFSVVVTALRTTEYSEYTEYGNREGLNQVTRSPFLSIKTRSSAALFRSSPSRIFRLGNARYRPAARDLASGNRREGFS